MIRKKSPSPGSAAHPQNAGKSFPDFDDALRETSRSIDSNLFDRMGLQRIRVLSESKFQELISKLVDRRVEEELRRRCWNTSIGSEIPVDSEDGLPIVLLEEDGVFTAEEDTRPSSSLPEKSEGERLEMIQDDLNHLNDSFSNLMSAFHHVIDMVEPVKEK